MNVGSDLGPDGLIDTLKVFMKANTSVSHCPNFSHEVSLYLTSQTVSVLKCGTDMQDAFQVYINVSEEF